MKKDIVRIIFVTLSAVFVRIICTLIFGGDPISTTEPFGNIAGLIGIIPSVIIMFLFSYLHLTLMGFYVIRKNLAGNYKNGFLFGLLIGLIWLFGMFEAGIIKQISLYKEFIFGISEAIPVIILGILISHVLKKEKIMIQYDKYSKKSTAIAVLLISVIYVIIRYLSYSIIHIESMYINHLLETLFWTFGNGILISVLYVFLRPFINIGNKLRSIIIFGIIIFGIDWFLYNMFVPVFFEISYFEIFRSYIIRSVMDVISICLGIYASEVFVFKKIN